MDVESRMKDFFRTCQEAGVKMTQQRIEIFREVAGSASHPDAGAVLEGLRDKMPTLSLDTVYRTLWMLDDLGLIKTHGTNRERTRFDANLNHHHHFICDNCGSMQDFESPIYDQTPVSVLKLGFAKETKVEVHGTCHDCL